ncbi:MAG: hypothetical protein Q7K65_01480 [Candidatus Buchananbacteria bacterium]|nr:hypothetical protein [Candidatus Buchananbacteria bacterium]
MKNIVVTVVVMAILGAVGFGYCLWQFPKDQSSEATIAGLKATIVQLQAAKDVYKSPAEQLDEAAKAGLTEMPGWQLQKIVAAGGDGSIFYQVEGSTRKETGVSTAGPLGFSWRSIMDDDLKAAAMRRGTWEEESEEEKTPE